MLAFLALYVPVSGWRLQRRLGLYLVALYILSQVTCYCALLLATGSCARVHACSERAGCQQMTVRVSAAQVVFVLIEEGVLWSTPWDPYQAPLPAPLDALHVPVVPMRS